MKRIATFLAFSLFGFSAMAQSPAATASSRRGLWVRPAFAIGGGTVVGADFGANVSTDFSIQISGGVDVGYMFTDKVGLFTGIGIGGYGASFSSYSYIYKEELIASTVYTEIPLYFQFISSHADKTGFFLNVGFKNGFLSGCETQYKMYDGTGWSTATTNDNSDKLYSQYSFSPFTYFGVNIRCGNRVDIDLGPEITIQATNLFSNNTNGASGGSVGGHYLLFAFKMGVGIHCTR